MVFDKLQFTYPLVLWGLALIPLVWLLFASFYRTNSPLAKLEEFIDPHLMKYLVINKGGKVAPVWRTLVIWSLVWSLLTVALAGPRWNFREIETYTADQNLIVLLDLSQSMDADDVSPTRLIRAKQKIEDLLNQSKGVQIGLVAFAADPHMITPLTQDIKTIKHLLPSLDTSLVHVQGSRLTPALEMAETMFELSSGDNQAVLVISDGGFEDTSAFRVARIMSDKGIKIYAMGVGTTAGAPVRDQRGSIIKKRGRSVLSKLQERNLQKLSQVGGGRYLQSDLAGNDESLVLRDLQSNATAMQQLNKKTKIWEDEFYWFIIPVLPFVLLWIRRGHIIPVLVLLLSPSFSLHAASMNEYFLNKQQLGVQALEEEDYEKAHKHFDDPYRQGVVQYRAGNFEKAETLFRKSNRPEVEMHAEYNAGNALVFQEKLEEAIEQYEKVLEKWPDHQRARENLELIKKMLEQQDQEEEQQEQEEEEKEKEDSGKSDEKESEDTKKNEKQSDQPDDKRSPDQEEKSDDQNGSGDQQPKEQQDSGQQDPNEQQDSGGKEKDPNDQQDSGDQERDSEEQKDEEGPGQLDQNEQEKEPGQLDPDEESGQGGEQQEEQLPGEGDQQEEQAPQQQEEQSMTNEEEGQGDAQKTEEDRDADQWLNRMNQEPTQFLRNKFQIESMRKGTEEAVDPW